MLSHLWYSGCELRTYLKETVTVPVSQPYRVVAKGPQRYQVCREFVAPRTGTTVAGFLHYRGYDMDQFTPIFDDVAAEYGLMTAAVYGVIWRHCQMKRGTCDASIETIAGLLNVSARTVIRSIAALKQWEVIIDMTPNRRNAPHVFKDNRYDTKSDQTKIGMTESHSGMTESHSGYDRESHEDTRIQVRDSDSGKPTLTVEQEMALLFGARKTDTNGNGYNDAERALVAGGWNIPDKAIYDACVYFLAASGANVPKGKPARKDWIASLSEHVQEYGESALDGLYPAAIEKMMKWKPEFVAARPGALTKTLATVALEMSQPRKTAYWL